MDELETMRALVMEAALLFVDVEDDIKDERRAFAKYWDFGGTGGQVMEWQQRAAEALRNDEPSTMTADEAGNSGTRGEG
ncbi:hypothetical protein HN371_01110 [Candidatus Poribacteria bacterium]|nr:hypothetical protein [Candidatus Poribacteria bacterium]